jgi:hypothetical protein
MATVCFSLMDARDLHQYPQYHLLHKLRLRPDKKQKMQIRRLEENLYQKDEEKKEAGQKQKCF